jgi:hypothetical protein
MMQVYAIAAVLGGTVLVCQFLMSLAGLGDHAGLDITHDVAIDHSVEGSWLFGMLAFRSVVAGVTFFGLSGMATSTWGAIPSFLMATVTGLSGLALVGAIMRAMVQLQSDGTLRVDRAAGCPGTVYLTVPAAQAGAGKVTVEMQNRTVEFQAVTNKQQDLPTGTKVVVVGIIGPDTVEVVPANEVARLDHV